jgi:Big-like domain-containing protein
MNLRRLSAAGATAALAASTIVGLTTATAHAETATATYTCTNTGYGLKYDFAITVDQTAAKPLAWAGQAVAKGALGKATVTAAIPADAAGLMATVGIDGAKSSDFALGLGSGKVPFPIAGGFTPTATGSTWTATAPNAAFTAPAPGAVTAVMPSKFVITVTSGGNPFADLDCALAAGQTAGSLWSATLEKQTTKTTAKNATGKAGKPVKVKVSVKGNGSVATAGQVVLTSGKKVVGKANVKNGVATVTVKKLKAGKNKLGISYKGTPSFGASKGKVTVTVK